MLKTKKLKFIFLGATDALPNRILIYALQTGYLPCVFCHPYRATSVCAGLRKLLVNATPNKPSPCSDSASSILWIICFSGDECARHALKLETV